MRERSSSLVSIADSRCALSWLMIEQLPLLGRQRSRRPRRASRAFVSCIDDNGVLRSCDTFDTNSRFIRSSSSRRSVITLNSRATCASSSLPLGGEPVAESAGRHLARALGEPRERLEKRSREQRRQHQAEQHRTAAASIVTRSAFVLRFSESAELLAHARPAMRRRALASRRWTRSSDSWNARPRADAVATSPSEPSRAALARPMTSVQSPRAATSARVRAERLASRSRRSSASYSRIVCWSLFRVAGVARDEVFLGVAARLRDATQLSGRRGAQPRRDRGELAAAAPPRARGANLIDRQAGEQRDVHRKRTAQLRSNVHASCP